MQRHQLQALSREELIAQAEQAGVPKPRVLTQAELIDEILKRTVGSEKERTRARGWLGRARDLLATVVEKGLHLPDAAAAIRNGPKGWPPPPPPLPTVTLAEIYAAQGHLERAVAVLDDVLRREPDHQEARELRERFLSQLTRGPKSSDAPVSAAADTEPSRAERAAAKETDTKPSDEPSQRSAPASRVVVVQDDADTLVAGRHEPEPRPGAAAPAQSDAETAAPARPAETDAPTPVAPETAAPAQPTETTAPTSMEATAPVAMSERAPVVELHTAAIGAPEDEVAPVADAQIHAAAQRADATKWAESTYADPSESVASTDPAGAPPAEEAPPAHVATSELTDVEAAAAEVAAAPDAAPVQVPEHYDVDEVVALAVDPSTFYVYWEVRPTTFAHMATRSPGGSLSLRVTAVTPGWDGPIVETRDVPIDALHGDHFIHHVRPRADVRVSVGWVSDGRFDPIAIGAEVSAPRAFVAAGAPAPSGAPLDLSEGPHGSPEGFARPVSFPSRERAAAKIAAGWVPRELAGTVIEGASDQAPEDVGEGPASWIWVPGPGADQVGMSVMFGPSTAQLPGSDSAEAGAFEGREWRRDPSGGVWLRDVESGSWHLVTEESGGWSWSEEEGGWSWSEEGGERIWFEGGAWGGSSEGGRWGGSSERRWGGASERRWGGASERRWGGASERRWGGASEGGRWGGASEGGRWGGSSERR
ncbi:MAG: DUF4912 domain-containing protein [Polyangiaceae bacterium]